MFGALWTFLEKGHVRGGNEGGLEKQSDDQIKSDPTIHLKAHLYLYMKMHR